MVLWHVRELMQSTGQQRVRDAYSSGGFSCLRYEWTRRPFFLNKRKTRAVTVPLRDPDIIKRAGTPTHRGDA